MTKELLQQALKSLIEVVSHAQHLTCTHENTHRGGAIWEICEDCGSQWADDRGGKPPYKVPPAIAAAEAAIVAIKAAIAQPVPPPEPLGRVAYYREGRTEFYPWPESPYLDNALDCKTVYAIAQPVPLTPANYHRKLIQDSEETGGEYWKSYAEALADDFSELADLYTQLKATTPQPVEGDAKDAERYRFLESEAYETVIPHGNKLNGSRTAWITKLHPGATFAEAIDAAIASQKATPQGKI